MSVEATMWIGVAGLTLITLVFLGPGLWSSATGYPLVEKPWAWFREHVLRKPKREPEAK